ncbi:MAG: flagellar motor switch protein FliN [Deltaproteobacteria bacterium]|nr:flagellar motor switch protein FliN [Deltaproteobacteria bacterium]
MTETPDTKNARAIDFLLDIPLELTVEVGRKTMSMADLMELAPGALIELNKASGDKLDILANGKVVARGEVVVVGDRYGVRVMEIIGDELVRRSSVSAGDRS